MPKGAYEEVEGVRGGLKFCEIGKVREVGKNRSVDNLKREKDGSGWLNSCSQEDAFWFGAQTKTRLGRGRRAPAGTAGAGQTKLS